MDSQKPNVLIIGGCGFVGRNLVTYLVDSLVCNSILVVDKMRPSFCFLSLAHQNAFSNKIVKVKQANAQSPSTF